MCVLASERKDEEVKQEEQEYVELVENWCSNKRERETERERERLISLLCVCLAF